MSHTPGRVLEEFPGYTVTSDGRVFSVSSNWRGYGVRELSQTPNTDGYPSVRVYDREGRRKRITVHRLVALAWVGPQPEGRQIRHLDGDKTNNHATNLRWGTAKDNAADREQHGRTSRGQRHSVAIRRGLPQ